MFMRDDFSPGEVVTFNPCNSVLARPIYLNKHLLNFSGRLIYMRTLLIIILALLSFTSAACGSEPQRTSPAALPTTAMPEVQTSGIGYPSVADALTALKTRKDVQLEVKDGWTIVTEPDGLTTWSFTPAGHAAYPAVARRVLYQDQSGWHIKMDVLCEADKAACDQFVTDFEALNEQMQKAIEQDQLTKQAP